MTLRIKGKTPLQEQLLKTDLERKGFTVELTEADIHIAAQGVNQLGEIAIIDGKSTKKLADFFKMDTQWKLVNIKCWAAYDGERLTLFTNKDDYIPEKGDEGFH